MGEVELDAVHARRPRRAAAADAKASSTSSISCSSSSFGIGAHGNSPGGTWLGATAYHGASKS